MSAGERLRRARLEGGRTLAQVSEQTKIQYWILDAIERNDLARVPGGVFIRGYLMSFARAVGLDGEQIWADFRSELSPRTVELEPAARRPVPAIGPWTILRIAAIVLVLAVVWRNISRTDSDTGSPQPLLIPERAEDVVLTAATTGIAEPERVATVGAPKINPAVPVVEGKKVAPVDQIPTETAQAPEAPANGDASQEPAGDEAGAGEAAPTQ